MAVGGPGRVVGTTKYPGEKHMTEVLAAIQKQFPQVRNGGISVVKKIKRTNTWSQHSWGNAVDCMVPNLAYGDEVYRWVMAHKAALGVGTVLWRVRDHFDHLHVEGANKYGGTPPAKGGVVTGTNPGKVSLPDVTAPFDAIGNAIGGVLDVGQFLGLLAQPATWLRVIWLIGGSAAVAGGIIIFTKELTGYNPLDGIGKVAKIIPTPASQAVSAITG